MLQVGRTLLHFSMSTTNSFTYEFLKTSKNGISDLDKNYLRLRKDNLKVPAEFFEHNNKEIHDTKTIIPPLNLPRDPKLERREKIAIKN